ASEGRSDPQSSCRIRSRRRVRKSRPGGARTRCRRPRARQGDVLPRNPEARSTWRESALRDLGLRGYRPSQEVLPEMTGRVVTGAELDPLWLLRPTDFLRVRAPRMEAACRRRIDQVGRKAFDRIQLLRIQVDDRVQECRGVGMDR